MTVVTVVTVGCTLDLVSLAAIMSGTELVVLRGGFSVSVVAYVTLLDFEARGIVVRRDGADLIVGPRELLADGDRALLRALKSDLIRLIDYCARPDLDAHLFSDRRAEQAAARVAAAGRPPGPL